MDPRSPFHPHPVASHLGEFPGEGFSADCALDHLAGRAARLHVVVALAACAALGLAVACAWASLARLDAGLACGVV